MGDQDIIRLIKIIPLDTIEQLKNDIAKIQIERIYDEIMSVIPNEIWKKIIIAFFSDSATDHIALSIVSIVCKKWTNAMCSIETLHINERVPPHFWDKFVRLKNLKISQNCTIPCVDSKFAYLEKLDLVDGRYRCTVDFSHMTNLTELSLSYARTTPENIHYLKKLKIFITLFCPTMTDIVNAKLSMLEKIILDASNCFMNTTIIDASPKLKIIGIYRPKDEFINQYISCAALMKHQIEIETDNMLLLTQGIVATQFRSESMGPEEIQITVFKSQNWQETNMNGMSSGVTYAKSVGMVRLSYHQYISICNNNVIVRECHGNCVNGQLSGYGTLRINGDVYSGMWEKNRPVGDFTVQYENGDRYCGGINEFYRISGSGTLTRCDGFIVTSDKWRNGAIMAKIC